MRATESKWASRIREWKASGESAEAYARGRGFEGSTLRWWSSRLPRGDVEDVGVGRRSRSPSVTMARVVRAPSSSAERPMVIRIGAARVEVVRGFDRALLRDVVEALGGES